MSALVLASNSAAVAAVSLVSLVIGYGLLAGLWYFVFSPGAERRAERRRQAGSAAEPQITASKAPATPAPSHDAERPRLTRRAPMRRR